MLPASFGSLDSEEIMYMRANYEHVIGNSDYELFHLVNRDECSPRTKHVPYETKNNKKEVFFFYLSGSF
ncbi:hypothetical protein V6N13_059943 [Hibiscus sabdariffa]